MKNKELLIDQLIKAHKEYEIALNLIREALEQEMEEIILKDKADGEKRSS